MSGAAEVALRYVRDVMGRPDARIRDVRPEPGGTSLAVACTRDPDTGVRWCWGVRVGPGGQVLKDVVLIGDWPDEVDASNTNVETRRTR